MTHPANRRRNTKKQVTVERTISSVGAECKGRRYLPGEGLTGTRCTDTDPDSIEWFIGQEGRSFPTTFPDRRWNGEVF